MDTSEELSLFMLSQLDIASAMHQADHVVDPHKSWSVQAHSHRQEWR
jgi:hypothetical protein